MRKQWFITWTLLAATVGCAGTGSLGSRWSAKKPQQTRQAAAMPAPGFTQKVLDAITPGPPKYTVQPKSNALSLAQQKLDPISLGSEMGPPSAALYLSMAQLSDQGGNTDHARSMYEKALSLEPENLQVLLGLARLEDREGRMDEALLIYQRATSAHPQNVRVLNDLALCHARMGQLPVSLQLLSKATQLQPQKALYRNNIAKVLVELDRIDEAAEHLAAVHPPAITQYNIGFLLHHRGRSAEAVHFLTAASHIDPQLQAASTLLSQITSDTTLMAGAETHSPNADTLPTPIMLPAVESEGRYPTTGALSTVTTLQAMPSETAQVPVGNAPVLLPPVR